MKTYDFINKNIGNLVYITGDRDLGMDGELRKLIHDKTILILVKLTKAGRAYLKDANGKFYSVPARNVREATELFDMSKKVPIFYSMKNLMDHIAKYGMLTDEEILKMSSNEVGIDAEEYFTIMLEKELCKSAIYSIIEKLEKI